MAGETKELTRGELMSLVRQADPDVRRDAYQEQYRVYGQDVSILGQMYQTLVRDWHNENVSLRQFGSDVSVVVNPDNVKKIWLTRGDYTYTVYDRGGLAYDGLFKIASYDKYEIHLYDNKAVIVVP